MGLVNQPAVPNAYVNLRAWVGGAQANITPISNENFLFGGGNTVLHLQAASNREGVSFRFQTASPSLCPAMIMVGTLRRLEVFYPLGWEPPLIHPVRDDIQLSNNAHPVARYVYQEPFKTTIPFRFRTNPEELTEVLKLIQRGSFLWRWKEDAPWMLMWGKVPMWRLSSPRHLRCGCGGARFL